ncbi:MAG: hypothetical protein WDO15_23035 [Bacteroidota bacterium]
MPQFLVSVYVAEAKLNTYVLTPDSAMSFVPAISARARKKIQHVGSAIQKTYQYYLAHPVELEQVYMAVIDTLNLLEQKATNKAK